MATADETVTELEAIRLQVNDCTKCPLHRTRHKAVFGEGNPHPIAMLIGEAPGYNEDIEGKPFVGAAGEFLDGLLSVCGLTRESVFITNIVKCRPPNNREPAELEVASCKGYLDRQIELINPKVIIPMGNVASLNVMKRFEIPWAPMGTIHSKIFQVSVPKGVLRIVPMYHPATALYKQPLAKTMKEDWARLRDVIA